MQLSIFDFMYEKFKITKPIKLIELLAGYHLLLLLVQKARYYLVI